MRPRLLRPFSMPLRPLNRMKAEERWDHQACVKVFEVAIQACPPENWGILLYPLQLLTGNVPLAALLGMLATIPPQAVADGELAPAPSIPSVLEMPAPQVDTKHWHCSSDQGVPPRQEEEEMAELYFTPKRASSVKMKRRKTLKEPCWEAFSKESEVWKWPSGPIIRPTSPTSSRMGHMTSPPLFGKWPPPLTSWAPRSMRCRRVGVVRNISKPPTKLLSPCPEISISLELFCLLSYQEQWAWRASTHPRPHDGGVA